MAVRVETVHRISRPPKDSRVINLYSWNVENLQNQEAILSGLSDITQEAESHPDEPTIVGLQEARSHKGMRQTIKLLRGGVFSREWNIQHTTHAGILGRNKEGLLTASRGLIHKKKEEILLPPPTRYSSFAEALGDSRHSMAGLSLLYTTTDNQDLLAINTHLHDYIGPEGHDCRKGELEQIAADSRKKKAHIKLVFGDFNSLGFPYIEPRRFEQRMEDLFSALGPALHLTPNLDTYDMLASFDKDMKIVFKKLLGGLKFLQIIPLIRGKHRERLDQAVLLLPEDNNSTPVPIEDVQVESLDIPGSDHKPFRLRFRRSRQSVEQNY